MNSITQSLLTGDYVKTIKVRRFSRRQAGNAAEIAETMREPHLGVSISLSTSGKVNFIAIATSKEVFLISSDTNNNYPLPRDKPFEDFLSGTTCSTLVGFEMARLAIQINRDLGIAVRGVDLGTLCSQTTRDPWRPGEFITKKVSSSAKAFGIDSIWGGGFEKDQREVCLRAWIAACASEKVLNELHNALKVDTRLLDPKELYCLGELVKQADLLDAAKPKEVPNEFTSHKMTHDGTLSITNARYRNRVRKGNQTSIIVTNADGREFSGHARTSHGKKTGIQFTGPALSGTLASVRVIGRQDPTNAEKACNEILLLFLRGQKCIRDSIFIRMLWFPSRRQRGGMQKENSVPPCNISVPLNNSQRETVQAMISDSPLVIVHGPPGTGKTTTISAAASIWDKAHQNAWIVAHSNVAVKNIAEKLVKQSVDFKLIVSKEFHFEWHEHIYELLGDNLIRTDELPKKAADTQKVLGSSSIVLSTLSTLSNPALTTNGLFKLVPVDRLVIDEASQIKIFDFLSVFAQFPELKKVCFFGDPKQLPPYGQETAPDLQTIFDLTHLQHLGHFLDTQYRMPVPIGNFISKHVYDGKLKSEHAITHKKCVSFINVAQSMEVKGGFSWKNFEEIRTIVHLVRNYYRQKDFCVITPYDAQRAAIEKTLKDEKLPWERVFNVDSFQGNEAKYVLISVVRSGGPGFLTSLNRMNVMLTRCQAGLVFVTSRSFLHGGGSGTLLGRLARHWEESQGDDAWVEWRSVASELVDLPGAPGRNKSSNPPGLVRPSSTVFSQPAPPTINPLPFQPQFVAPVYSFYPYGYGWNYPFPAGISSTYPIVHPAMNRSTNPLMNRAPTPDWNYDEAFPRLYSSVAMSSSTWSSQSLFNAKPKPEPPKPTQQQENIRPAPPPPRYHTPPARFYRSAPQPRRSAPQPKPRPAPPPPHYYTPPARFYRSTPQPKPSDLEWQPISNNGRTKRFTLTGLGYSL